MDPDAILRNARLENLNESGKRWLVHAAACLFLFAEQRQIEVRITRAFCAAGTLRLSAETDGERDRDKMGVLRISRSVLRAARLLPAPGRIAPTRVEKLRTFPVFEGTFVDYEIPARCADSLLLFARGLTERDKHARRAEAIELRALFGGAGPILAGFRVAGGERNFPRVAEMVSFAADAVKSGGLPGIRWYLTK